MKVLKVFLLNWLNIEEIMSQIIKVLSSSKLLINVDFTQDSVSRMLCKGQLTDSHGSYSLNVVIDNRIRGWTGDSVRPLQSYIFIWKNRNLSLWKCRFHPLSYYHKPIFTDNHLLTWLWGWLYWKYSIYHEVLIFGSLGMISSCVIVLCVCCLRSEINEFIFYQDFVSMQNSVKCIFDATHEVISIEYKLWLMYWKKNTFYTYLEAII